MHGQRAPTPSDRKRLSCPRGKPIAFVAVLAAVSASSAIDLARADQGVPVLLLRRVPADEILTEAILRIKSELVAGGFQVAVADSDGAEPDPRALMVRAARTLAPSATIGIFGDLQKGSAELWVVDRLTSKTVIRRLVVQASPDRPISEVLAIRAQELLRASLVEVLVEENRPAPPVELPPEIHRRVKQTVASPLAPWILGLELGGAAFGGLSGIGPTLAPAARLRLAMGERFWVRLTALGLGTRPRVGTDDRSASVSQNLLLLEFAACLRPRRLVRPLFSVGLGTERVAVDGTAGMPYQGEHNARWFAAGDVGAGVVLRLHAHLEVQLEVHALFAAPRPTIRFFDVEAARAGQPTWLAILTLAGGA
jgi:hypothetical protein